LEKLEDLVDWLVEGRIGQLPAAIAVVAAYCLLQTATLPLLSSWAGTGVGIDDAEQLIYQPYLWAGYGGSQPPLYNWTTWTVTHLIGANVLALKIVKYSFLFAGFACAYAAMRKLAYRRTTTVCATLGLMTLPQLFWEAQRALSHSVAAFAASAALLLAFAILAERRSLLAHALFGFVAALAVLAKFNDILIVFAIVAAALSIREYRAVFLDRRVLAGLVVFLLTIAPTTIWSVLHIDTIFSRVYKFGIDGGGDGFLGKRVQGLSGLLTAGIQFVAATVAAYCVAFVWKRRAPATRQRFGTAPDSLLGRSLLIGLGATVLLVLASGSTTVRGRWLLPVLFLFPLYAAARVEKLGELGLQVQRFVITVAAAISLLVLPATWAVQVIGGEGGSRTTRIDYRALTRDIKALGPVRTLFADAFWVGNFRLVDPDLVLLNPEVPEFGKLLRQPSVLIWLRKEQPSPDDMARLREAGYEPFGDVVTLKAREFWGPDDGWPVHVMRLRRQGTAGAE